MVVSGMIAAYFLICRLINANYPVVPGTIVDLVPNLNTTQSIVFQNAHHQQHLFAVFEHFHALVNPLSTHRTTVHRCCALQSLGRPWNVGSVIAALKATEI
jgi:hypothetical protein